MAEDTDKFNALPEYVSYQEAKRTNVIDVLYIVHDDAYGYATAAKGYLHKLQKNNVSFRWIGLKTSNTRSILAEHFSVNELIDQNNICFYNTYVFHTIPTTWKKIYSELPLVDKDVKIIGRTVWEFEKMLPEWIDAINDSPVNYVSVPTEWNKKIFEKNGITKKIVVEPHIIQINPELKVEWETIVSKATVLSHTNPHDINFSSFYKFYSIGDLSERKNIENTIRYFCRSFTVHDDVMLLIKLDVSSLNYLSTMAKLHSIVHCYDSPPLIMIIASHLSDDEMHGIHIACDCYFQLTRSEGFGLNMFTARQFNKPILVPKYGGHVEILADYDKVTYLDYTLIPVNSIIYNDTHLSDEYQWAEVDASECRSKLNVVYRKYNVQPISVSQKAGILYIGQYGTSGYAIAAKGYIVDFIKRGIPVRWEPLYFDNSKLDNNSITDLIALSAINKNIKFDTVIIHCTPDLWSSILEKNARRFENKHIIGYLAWETSRLKPDWVTAINQIKTIQCPSEYNRQVFIESGVTSNITVVPHIFHGDILPDRESITISGYTPGHTTFYTIGELNERKNILALINAFCEEFTGDDPVQLICKVHHKKYDVANKTFCSEVISGVLSQYKNHPKCIFIYDALTDLQLRALHSIGDCYVSLTRSEGFGLTIFDAYKYGNDVIVTGYGGHVEFLGENHPGLVKYKLINVGGMSGFNTNYEHSDQVWAEPDVNHFRKLIKQYARSISTR
jgi:glycosyltransferase involved in cell wall biosynthesis